MRKSHRRARARSDHVLNRWPDVTLTDPSATSYRVDAAQNDLGNYRPHKWSQPGDDRHSEMSSWRTENPAVIADHIADEFSKCRPSSPLHRSRAFNYSAVRRGDRCIALGFGTLPPLALRQKPALGRDKAVDVLNAYTLRCERELLRLKAGMALPVSRNPSFGNGLARHRLIGARDVIESFASVGKSDF